MDGWINQLQKLTLIHCELMSFLITVAAVVTVFAAGLMVTETPQKKDSTVTPMSLWFIDVERLPTTHTN